MLEIRTLGGLSLQVNGKALKGLGSHKAEALLVYLAVEGRQVNRRVLEALFWPESSQTQAQTALRVVLSVLRRDLGAYLEITRQTVAINNGARLHLDLSDLQAKLVSGRVTQALGLFHGDFLEGFQIHASPAFEDWQRLEQERVRKSIVSALHTASSEAIERKEYSKGLTYAQRLVEINPLDEPAHRLCMLLLTLADQHSAALAQYERCRAILRAELGIDPSQATQQLYEQIAQGEDLSSLVPTLPRNNLPAPQTSFVGREAELAQIEALLHDPACRLLTLVGPGGSGKTRLALQAATRVLRAFPDGTFFVPLESIPSSDYLVPAVAESLEFDIDTFASPLDPRIQLLDYLRKRSMLIVMDGFDQLIEGADLLSGMLSYAPRVQILVTTRQKLNLHGEWIFQVGGLPVPEGIKESKGELLHEPSSVELFVDRAHQVKPDFRPAGSDYEQMIRICQLVEGMPLGIELAAACMAVLSPGEITAEMEKSLDLLATSRRDVPQKHRSLRAAFDRSWHQLNEE